MWLLSREVKLKVLGLTSLECTIARQRSRITWLTEGGANTKIFHLHARHHMLEERGHDNLSRSHCAFIT
jgi:hypothetical protein